MSSKEQRARFGAKVRQHRLNRGWSQNDLADRLGCSESAVGNWEQGRGAGEDSVLSLERVFGLEPGTLGSDLGHAPAPVAQPPEDAIEADERIPDEHKRTLLAHLAEVRRLANEQG